MAAKNFPGPNINRLIDKDPQIVKINVDYMEFGSRPSIFAQLSGDPRQNPGTPGQPTAPEITISHVSSKA